MVQRYTGTMVQWYNVQWYNDTMVQWYRAHLLEFFAGIIGCVANNREPAEFPTIFAYPSSLMHVFQDRTNIVRGRTHHCVCTSTEE